MAYVQTTSPVLAVQEPPVVTELRALFDNLDDEPLLTALVGPTRRGPKGHPVRVLWQCLVAKYRLGLGSTDALIRELRNNPFVAEVCGIESPDDIPHKSTFSRFFKRLSLRKFQHLVKDVSRRLVRRHYETLPGFGQNVAMDSTVLKGWSNGGKPRKADPEAAWSVKKNTHGKTEYTYGWKLHLLVDCEYELPIAANVSAGNVHDSQRASNLLSEARFTYSLFHPRFVMADAGYSAKALFHLIRGQYRATPVIDVNRTHKRLLEREGVLLSSPAFKALARLRPAVERVYSRLKGQRSLNRITTRRKAKVVIHCYLSLIALQAAHPTTQTGHH